MDPDTDADRLVLRGLCGCSDREAAPDCAAHGVEDDVEAVALGLDLRAPESPDRVPGKSAVPRQKLRCRCGAVPLHEVRVTPEIREQEAASDRASVLDRHAGAS
jgi:hypothetical protein